MRVYTIDVTGSTPVALGVTVEEIPLHRRDITVTGFRLGERGRNRWETIVPVRACEPKETVENVRVTTTRSGNVALVASDVASDDDKVLAVMKIPGGFRGGVSWDRPVYDWDGSNRHIMVPAQGILAVGRCAQGIAGRMGQWEEIILSLSEGESISFQRYGRLYGRPAKWTLKLIEGDPVCLPDQEWDLISEARE